MIKQVTANKGGVASNELTELYTKIFRIEQFVGRKHTKGREPDARVLADSLSISSAYMLEKCADLNIPIWDIKRAASERVERLIDSWSRVVDE